MPKFNTVDELREFFENASPEDIRALNRELGRKLVKKILLGLAIGAAIGTALVLAAKALEKNESENLDNVIYDTTADI
jgi:amino acid permease